MENFFHRESMIKRRKWKARKNNVQSNKFLKALYNILHETHEEFLPPRSSIFVKSLRFLSYVFDAFYVAATEFHNLRYGLLISLQTCIRNPNLWKVKKFLSRRFSLYSATISFIPKIPSVQPLQILFYSALKKISIHYSKNLSKTESNL